VTSQLAFSVGKDNKIEINDVPLNFFIKSEWNIVCLNPKN
jgi:hypothetical protein